MNEVKLSKRLETVAGYITKGGVLADIGSDHAYLPCYAWQKGLIAGAIAGEVVEGPFQSAKSTVAEYGLGEHIAVRKGDGLAVMSPGEADVITICGMGGALIRDILERGKDKLAGVTRLVLQPNIGAHNIREWLIANGWELQAEEMMKEDGKIYEILVAERGDSEAPYRSRREHGILFGPFLLAEKSEVFAEKWRHELQNMKRIQQQLQQAADTEETLQKRQEVAAKIAMMEEVLA
ncbi:tRNA (adenine(22)-N(1))-methyltransferase [Ectobacillus ponti]|uniref:tRNA (Adenine(22)-N(1))-methyltransferase TrmK n=1 Tax=Ectobacillus ponti TaxID=2961894 RepID=A0AA41X1B9_9BACI|nr:tRNA (adenine(22)-N(1))-methyltransferase TrmK [Ectobacillus ponti]MCP8967154.1 tRNA (adenine(22)-N(1))-methyltransferase TrmK [Ectobacillus ponti]